MSIQVIIKILVVLLLSHSFNLTAAVIVTDKMWPKNTTLNVVFIDGTINQKAQVKQYAPLWLEKTSLKFTFYDDFESAPKATHIRISFADTTGSMLGNHGNYYSQEPTLQLNKLNEKDLPIIYIRRYILHEFGHALGLEHEFRNPHWPYGNATIEQQINACIPRLKLRGYAENLAYKECREINKILDKSSTKSTIYDESSIMNYPLEIILSNNQPKQIVATNKLSILDKIAIRQWYN